jgi:S1-C subfamily serine protease
MVYKNTAAHRAGLQAFDYIVAINDYDLSKDKSLGKILAKFDADEEVTIHYYRNGEKKSQKVTLGSREDRDFNYNQSSGEAFLGITPHSKNQNDELGVKVNVINYSAAHEMGIKDGDIITDINGAKMIDWQDISTAIDNLKPGDSVNIDYLREGNSMQGSANIKSYEETNELRKSKKYDRAFLGINYSKLSKRKAKKLNIDNPYGSYVTGVVPNTAADKAGVEVFDYIYGVDEYRVGESQSMGGILSKYSAGDAATLHLIRKGNIKKLDLTFGRKSDAQPVKRSKCEDPFFGIQKSHKAPAENGIRVSVVSNSTAKDLGLENGDVITAINGYPMIDWDDISAAIDLLEVGETIKVDYERSGNKMQGSKAIKSYCDTKGDMGNNFKIEIDEDDFDFDFDFDFGDDDDDDDDDDDRRLRSAASGMRNVNGMEVKLTDISSAEANEMKTQHGIDMPTVNNLSIQELKMFPNPSKGMFRLSFDLPQSGDTVIRIYNAQGRKIYEYDLGEFSGDFSDEVDISQNGTGTYFLEIRQGGKSKTQKIILKRS